MARTSTKVTTPAAVAPELSPTEDTQVTAPAPSSEDRLADALRAQAEAIGRSVADGITASRGRQKVSYGDYLIAHPKRKLLKPAFQNGFEINPKGLSDAVIQKLAELVPGSYLNGLVHVGTTKNGAINLQYNNKSIDDRMTFASQISSFSDMVTKVYADMQSRLTQ